MVGMVVSAALVCGGSVLLGQAVVRLSGGHEWSWLSPTVGFCVLMLVAIPAIHVPGRAFTVFVLLTLLAAACLVAALRDPRFRVPPIALATAVPIALLGLVPFAAAGDVGMLGVSFNNDTASHLAWAEAYASESVARFTPIEDSYPLGPHAVVAALSSGLGIPVLDAFAGLNLACPILLGWTALGFLRRARWPAQLLLSSLAGLPFLVAGYYAQGSFKEVLQAAFVLATALALHRREELSGRFRWLPLALLVAGVLSVYTFAGLAWPVAIGGIFLAGVGMERFARDRSLPSLRRLARSEAAALGVALLALAVLLLPQGPRIVRFFVDNVGTNATGIETNSLGNLAARLPVWEAFGVWDNPDYRLPALDPFTSGMWTAFVLGLAVVGAIWLVRGGNWVLPMAATAAFLIWVVSDRTQSPYVAAKALVILAPLLMLVAAVPLLDRGPPADRWPLAWRVGAFALAVVLTWQVLGSSWGVLRTARVGPRAHLEELRELRPVLDERRTLFLGNDDYIRWELAGIPVDAPVIGFLGMSTRPEKPWQYGDPLDFDSLDAATLDRYHWIITPRDAAGSRPPEQLRLERETRSFQLWRRTAPIESRSVLAEGAAAAARLNCSTPAGRDLARAGGVALVRRPTVSFTVPAIPAGGVHEARLRLAPGTWELQAPYQSQHPIHVTGTGLDAELPAQLDRPGTRWPIGRIRVTGTAPVTLRFRVADAFLTPPGRVAGIGPVLATPVSPPRILPLREACGKLVDWFRRA